MWSGRNELVTLRDVLLVPDDVRHSLGRVLPSSEFTVYGLSWNHAGAVTSHGDDPYELYLPYSTARTRPDTLEALARTRDMRDDLCRKLLPADADAGLPLCRDVWHTVRGKPWRQSALDILFPKGQPPATFPLRANVLVFSEDDVMSRDFTRPLSIEFNVPLRFK